jgi:two-component system KDP operon response regulator KdpE
VIREVRAFSQVPIIVLSARDRETEKISALDLGADDYVNKPFGIGELLARIRAVTRSRNQGKPVETVFRAAGLTIDTERHNVELDGQHVKLTPKEFDLLLLLVRNAGRVLTHKQILNTVWGPAHAEDVQYLRVLVGQLRQKIEKSPTEPILVLTEPGIGYRLSG